MGMRTSKGSERRVLTQRLRLLCWHIRSGETMSAVIPPVSLSSPSSVDRKETSSSPGIIARLESRLTQTGHSLSRWTT